MDKVDKLDLLKLKTAKLTKVRMYLAIRWWWIKKVTSQSIISEEESVSWKCIYQEMIIRLGSGHRKRVLWSRMNMLLQRDVHLTSHSGWAPNTSWSLESKVLMNDHHLKLISMYALANQMIMTIDWQGENCNVEKLPLVTSVIRLLPFFIFIFPLNRSFQELRSPLSCGGR